MLAANLFAKAQQLTTLSSGNTIYTVDMEGSNDGYTPNDLTPSNKLKKTLYVAATDLDLINIPNDTITAIGSQDYSLNPLRIIYVDRTFSHIHGFIRIVTESAMPIGDFGV